MNRTKRHQESILRDEPMLDRYKHPQPSTDSLNRVKSAVHASLVQPTGLSATDMTRALDATKSAVHRELAIQDSNRSGLAPVRIWLQRAAVAASLIVAAVGLSQYWHDDNSIRINTQRPPTDFAWLGQVDETDAPLVDLTLEMDEFVFDALGLSASQWNDSWTDGLSQNLDDSPTNSWLSDESSS